MPITSNYGAKSTLVAFYGTTQALPANTYADGPDGANPGIGATLTYNSNGVAANIDGQTPAVNDLVFVNQESSQSHQGLYRFTDIGSVGTPAILMRAASCDTPDKIAGSAVFILTGTLLVATKWYLSGLLPAAITVGATSLAWKPKFQMIAGNFGSAQNFGSSTARFLSLGTVTTTSPSGTESVCQFPAPCDGVLAGLEAAHTSAGLANDYMDYTARIAGADTSLTCRIAASGRSAVDNTVAHWARFNQGDLLSIKIQQQATQAAANITPRASLLFLD